MNQNFAAIILGGTGQVGGAAVAELLAIPECREVVMVTRKYRTALSVASLANQINNGPMFFALLEMIQSQRHGFMASQAVHEQQC
jgi:branched-subunit amino acid ABC-type transport system permease component